LFYNAVIAKPYGSMSLGLNRRVNVHPSEVIHRQQKVAAVNQFRYPRPAFSGLFYSVYL
jgi:hypothetical protein